MLRAHFRGVFQIRHGARDLEYAVMRPARESEALNGFAKKSLRFRIRARTLFNLAPGELRIRCTLAIQLNFARP